LREGLVSSASQSDKRPPIAVLVSGGLDSAVLAAFEAQKQDVQPLYVSCGLPWEPIEQAFLVRFLAEHRGPCAFLPLVRLELPVRDVYPKTHWAIGGVPPAYETADEDVYLVGRNITLLTKAGIYCAFARLSLIAVGQLQGNPFPDATPEFFTAMARALSLGLNHRLEIAFPFLSKSKADVIRLGASLNVPFELTLSCMNPKVSGHCGACSKCRERREAFIASGIADPATYASLPANQT
jgi:7-cyano-7-deazaguanine synthase